MMLNLETSINKLAGIGPKLAERLNKLGIDKVSDLLYHFPFRYDDFSKITPISKIRLVSSEGDPGAFCVKGKILEIKNQRTPRKYIIVTNAIIQDETGSLKIVWFSQPYLARILGKGTRVILAGKVEYGRAGLIMQNPSYEKVSFNTVHTGRIIPIYPETKGLSSKWLRRIIMPLLKLTNQIDDYLPLEIIKKNSLISLPEALRQIHFPDSLEMIQKAKKRLAFDELFLMQLKMLNLRRIWRSNKAPKVKLDIELIKKLVRQLPFKLTNAQRKSAWEILQDISKKTPMNRLLEGDVGSGKTIVAAIAMLVSAKSGFQSILMAPTEILANQHFINISDLLAPFGLKIGLLVSSKTKVFPCKKELSRKKIIEQIKSGKIDIIIGTHALISDKINFDRVSLAVIDEQHRFGTKQRALLRKKAKTTPHLLSMTATPIPRTLTLALYGDLDLSVIDELPVGRQKISTHLVKPEKRNAAYKFIADQIKEGRQIFVICPLIEESDRLGVKSAEVEYKKLKKEIFPQFKIALLHGKMKTSQKEKIMKDFQAGKSNILVSTAVVEVGVDIPNASVMMIEGADRFGLAQLHQFRGRVGRANYKSYCFLFTDLPFGKTFKRLGALVNMHDGFQLAEKDLEIRGPGEVYGVRQHGLADLKMASLTDIKMIKLAREEAEKIIQTGLDKFPKLEVKLEEYRKERKLE